MPLRRSSALAVPFLIAACATTGNDGQRSDRHLITAEELAQGHSADAYQAVERLRPHFLRRRGPATIHGEGSETLVYVDGIRLGGVGMLRSLSVTDIREIRYIDARDATTRWGTGHSGGVIYIATRGSPPN